MREIYIKKFLLAYFWSKSIISNILYNFSLDALTIFADDVNNLIILIDNYTDY